MADKKFGQKRVCTNCEVKFYDLNKKSPLTCPHCNNEIIIEDDLINIHSSSMNQSQDKSVIKDEFSDLENTESASEENEDVISLDEADIEEQSEAKN